jgi:hypothetical protein
VDAPASGQWRPSDTISPGKRLVLHLGILEQNYDTPGVRSRKVMTTYTVAKILERNYGVMQMFWDVHGQDVATDLEESFQGALEARLMGHTVDPFGRGMQSVERRFREFISTREVERQGFAPRTRLAGRALLQIPTKAALRGVNPRLAHPYSSRNPRRPSFNASGIYMGSFRAWVST